MTYRVERRTAARQNTPTASPPRRRRRAVNLTAVPLNLRHIHDSAATVVTPVVTSVVTPVASIVAATVQSGPGALPTSTATAPRSLSTIFPHRWYTLRSMPDTGVRNMACDLALMSRARRTGDAVWRCYAWSTPTVSFGRHERTRGHFDTDSVARAGLDAVRRPTGGRALLHARELTYSVTLPMESGVPWRAAYDAINAILLHALQSLGVPASMVAQADATPVRPDGPRCFDAPAVGEIVVGRAKLVGSAVWRERGAFLQHGSILLHDDQSRLVDATRVASTPPPPAASLHDCFESLGQPCPTWSDVADTLEAALAETRTVTPLHLDATTADEIAAHAQDIARDAWLWRR